MDCCGIDTAAAGMAEKLGRREADGAGVQSAIDRSHLANW
jgi:hypothetical protein